MLFLPLTTFNAPTSASTVILLSITPLLADHSLHLVIALSKILPALPQLGIGDSCCLIEKYPKLTYAISFCRLLSKAVLRYRRLSDSFILNPSVWGMCMGDVTDMGDVMDTGGVKDMGGVMDMGAVTDIGGDTGSIQSMSKIFLGVTLG